MPVDPIVIPSPYNPLVIDFWGIIRIGLIILMIFYFFFSLIVVRQIKLMTETVMTETGSILRAFSILHAGIVLGILILYIGFF